MERVLLVIPSVLHSLEDFGVCFLGYAGTADGGNLCAGRLAAYTRV